MMQTTSMRPSVASIGNVAGLRPRSLRSPAPQPQRMVVRAAAGAAGRVGGGSPTGPQGTGLDFVPDVQKRTVMNLLLVGALGLPGTALLGPFVYFFVPKSSGSAGGGVVAKDALGNDVKASKWLASHKPGDHSLTQGLKADATYLIVNDQGEIEKFGLNAVCTHLGCVVPWDTNENKFKCPCHGSQYNFQGKVVRGPAPLSLALAHMDIQDDLVTFTPWTETDFRTGLEPWWS